MLIEELGAEPVYMGPRRALHEWKKRGAPFSLLSLLANGAVPHFTSAPVPFDLGDTVVEGEVLATWEVLRAEYMRLGGLVKVSGCKYVSKAFFIPKRLGGYRLIIDLRPLNAFSPFYPTEYDTLHTLDQVLQPNDYLASFDLLNGYMAIGIHPDYWQYFGFRINGQEYCWTFIPFGWGASPALFQSMSTVLVQFLKDPLPVHYNGQLLSVSPIRARAFLDDFLLIFSTLCEAVLGVQYVKGLLMALGLQWHDEKSVWEPCQTIEHLGLIVDTVTGQFLVPYNKLLTIRDYAKLLLSELTHHRRWVPARQVAKMCGLVQCISLAFQGARLFCRSLYDGLCYKAGWNAKVQLTHQAAKDLHFLSKIHQHWNGRSVWAPIAEVEVWTDASRLGWGAIFHNKTAHGHWAPDQKSKHIQVLELWAVYYALYTFRSELRGKVVLLKIDNMAVVYGVRNFTSKCADMMPILRKLFWLLRRYSITTTTQYIQSEHNLADPVSRISGAESWMLSPSMFKWLSDKFGPFTCDRFASQNGHLCPKYNSLHFDPGSSGVNCFLQTDWLDEFNWCNPPWTEISKLICLFSKLDRTRLRAGVLVPKWPTAPWYSKLILMANRIIEYPSGTRMFCSIASSHSLALMPSRWPVLFLLISPSSHGSSSLHTQ